MIIQVNFGDISGSDALGAHVEQAVNAALDRFEDRVTRVEVHLRDDKQKRRGLDDKRCLMEVRPAGSQPFAVEAKAADIYEAVNDCAGRLQRAVARHFERKETHRPPGVGRGARSRARALGTADAVPA